jgi:exonuclease III
MTAKRVVVNLDRIFSPGQAYVAISRVTSKDGLFIETNDDGALQKKIYADKDVKLALDSFERFNLAEDLTCNVAESENFKTIVLLNVQSLKGHFQEMICDKRLTKADFVCLTETWLKEHENIQDVEIPGFEFHHVARKQCYNNSNDVFTKLQTAKGGGVGVYKKNTNEKILVSDLECKNIEGIAVELYQDNIAIIVLYRPSVLPVNNFLDTLHKVVEFYMKRQNNLIIVGDLNEDAKMQGPIQSCLESMRFQQLVQFYTTEGGTILDHVYVSGTLKACVHKISIYFSYHEGIEIHVRTK